MKSADMIGTRQAKLHQWPLYAREITACLLFLALIKWRGGEA